MSVDSERLDEVNISPEDGADGLANGVGHEPMASSTDDAPPSTAAGDLAPEAVIADMMGSNLPATDASEATEAPAVPLAEEQQPAPDKAAAPTTENGDTTADTERRFDDISLSQDLDSVPAAPSLDEPSGTSPAASECAPYHT